MKKVAFVFGILWLAALAVAGLALLTSGSVRNVRGLMYALIGAAIPGFLLVHWGSGNKARLRRSPNPLTAKAPYDRAAEAGHVMRIDPRA